MTKKEVHNGFRQKVGKRARKVLAGNRSGYGRTVVRGFDFKENSLKPDQPHIDQKETLLESTLKRLRQANDMQTVSMLVDAIEGPMTPAEAAVYINSTEESVRKMARRGKIPFHKKIHPQFYRHELNAWIQESEYGRTLRKAV